MDAGRIEALRGCPGALFHELTRLRHSSVFNDLVEFKKLKMLSLVVR